MCISRCTLIGQQYDTLRGECEEKNGKKYRSVCLPRVTFAKVFPVKHTENKLASKTTYFGRIGYKVVYRSLIYQTGLQIYPYVSTTVIVKITMIIATLINNNNNNNYTRVGIVIVIL